MKRAIMNKDHKVTGIEVSFWSVTEATKVLAALQDARERFHRQLLDRVPVHIYQKDTELRITYANHHHCKHFGKGHDELVGTTDRDHFPRELWEAYERDDLRVIRDRETIDRIEEHTLRNETRRRPGGKALSMVGS